MLSFLRYGFMNGGWAPGLHLDTPVTAAERESMIPDAEQRQRRRVDVVAGP